MTHPVIQQWLFYWIEAAKDTNLVRFVLNVRYKKTFIKHPAAPLIKKVCLDTAEGDWIADCGGCVMDCVNTVFHK